MCDTVSRSILEAWALLRPSMETTLFNTKPIGIWHQTNTPHVAFLNEPSWLTAARCLPAQPGLQRRLCFAVFLHCKAPLGMLLLLFLLESGCPGHDKATLPQRERHDWNFTFFFDFIEAPEEDECLILLYPSSSLLWGPLENPKQALLRPPFPCCKRTSPAPETNILPFGRPTKGRSGEGLLNNEGH